MGLDMYAEYRKPRKPDEPELTEDEEDDSWTEFAYWRKHNALHGWMEDQWRKEGNEGTFNWVRLPLTLEMITSLEAAVLLRSLEPREGFFFGFEGYNPADYLKEDLKFIKEAKEYISKGYEVSYNSSW